MKILVLEKETPGVTPEMFQPHLKAEARRVWDLQQAGILREIWFTADDHTAVIVLECDSREAAQETLASLPLVKPD